MIATPRQRAAAAFAIIDRHHGNQSNPTVDAAYRELAAAMDACFGELPPETQYERQGRLRAVETNHLI